MLLSSSPLSLLPLILYTTSIVQFSGAENTNSNSEGILGSPCNTTDKDSCQPQSVYVCQPRLNNSQIVEGGPKGNDGKCDCRQEGYVPYRINQTCLPKATRLGQPCRIDAQCGDGESDPDRASYCAAGACACFQHLIPAANGTNKCLSKPGMSCKDSSDCVGSPELAECFNDDDDDWRECQCRKETSAKSSNGKECLPLRNLGESCMESGQCQVNQECFNSTCSSSAPGSIPSHAQT